MEYRQAEGRPATSWGASEDDSARFLLELRQLRDGAGLGQAELAARAHYPYDRIRAAEVGPSLPDLPVLSAYVRGCGAAIEEWEERWRSLTSAPTLPLLAARPAGTSTAADAGARIGSISPAADTPDPSIILAALDRVAEEMAVGTSAPPAPSSPSVPPAPLAPPAPRAPLPSRSGVSTIDQRPGVAPAAAKSAGGKAGAGQLAAWETTTMRTAWSSGPGPATRETGPAVAEPAAAEPVAAEPATATAAATAAVTAAVTAVPGPAPIGPRPGAGRRSQPRSASRMTTVALIAIAICLVVAVIAIFV